MKALLYSYFVIIVIVFCSCESKLSIDTMKGISYPVEISEDLTSVDFSKRLDSSVRVKSIKLCKNLSYIFIPDSISVVIDKEGEIPPLSNMHVTTTKGDFDILVKNINDTINKSGVPMIIGKSIEKDMITFTIEGAVDSVLVYINNKLLPSDVLLVENNEITLEIPSFSTIPDNSVLRVYAFNYMHGASNEFCVPLNRGEAITSVADVDTTTITSFNIKELYSDEEYLKMYKKAVNTFIYLKHSYNVLDSAVVSSIDDFGAYRLINQNTGERNYMPVYKSLVSLNNDLAAKLVDYKKPRSIKRLQNRINQLNTFLMTIPGVPTYYIKDKKIDKQYTGQEFNFGKIENLRRNNIPLIYGSYISLRNDNLTYAYVRKYFDEFTIVIFNRSKFLKKRKIELHTSFINADAKALFGSRFDIVKGQLLVELQPYSVEIITGKITD